MSIVAPIKFNSAPIKISGVPVKIGDGTVKISVAVVPVLLTPLVHERGTVQGRDLVGIVEGPCGYRARGVNIREKIVLSRNPWYKTKAVAMQLNEVLTHVVLTPGTLPRSSGTGPSASCGYCCPHCPTGEQYSGKIRFIEP